MNAVLAALSSGSNGVHPDSGNSFSFLSPLVAGISHIVGHLWDKCGMDLHRYQFSAVADLVMEKRDFEHKKACRVTG